MSRAIKRHGLLKTVSFYLLIAMPIVILIQVLRGRHYTTDEWLAYLISIPLLVGLTALSARIMEGKRQAKQVRDEDLLAAWPPKLTDAPTPHRQQLSRAWVAFFFLVFAAAVIFTGYELWGEIGYEVAVGLAFVALLMIGRQRRRG